MKLCLTCDHTFESTLEKCERCGAAPARIDGIPAYAPELAVSGAGFKAGDFADLRRVEDSYFWFRSRTKLLVRMLKRYFPAVSSILEIGCGTGFVLAAFEQAYPLATIQGSEVYSEGLRFARTRLPRAEFFQPMPVGCRIEMSLDRLPRSTF